MNYKVYKTKSFNDHRGFFYESYNYEKLGIKVKFIQDNIAYSKKKGTLRGLHLQKYPFSQKKLITVIKGSVQDIIVDLRIKSPNFGQYKSFILSENNNNLLYIPEGFAHGYCTLENDTIIMYKVSKYYKPKSEVTIKWSDENLKIKWKINKLRLIISDKDKKGISFNKFVRQLK